MVRVFHLPLNSSSSTLDALGGVDADIGGVRWPAVVIGQRLL